jgi:8-oxo-dGTP pyrophosphatase MutT (NUDIX family)
MTSDGFTVSAQRETYEEIGVVIGVCPSITDIPLGSHVYFDSYMAKKYPVKGDTTKFQWFVHYDEIVKFEYADETVSK